MKSNRNNHEVEIRALLTPVQRKELLRTLRHTARFNGREKITDWYLCPSNVKTFGEIEMHDVGSYSLRVREKLGVQGAQLNAKVITRRGDHNAWEEHEIVADKPKELLAILQAMRFKIYFTLTKVRQNFSLKEFSLHLEDIANFGSALEIEIMTSRRDAPDAKKRIRALLARLGIKKEQIVRKSVTNLLMRKRASFT